jgi:tRNA(Arg) A34 adenosine deaminase TadA
MLISCTCTRRTALATIMVAGAAVLVPRGTVALDDQREFIEAAFRMRDEAVRTGDQAYGAVIVKDRRIIGFGPSRVMLKKDQTAHAEREAIREAQARLGTMNLSGAILYSSSRPCPQCEAAAAEASITRMFYGRDAVDAGKPRRS